MKLMYVQSPSRKRLVTALTPTCFYEQTSWMVLQQCSITISILVNLVTILN